MSMTLDDVLAFVKKQNLMLLATVAADGKPEASVVEYGETDSFTIIFDTLMSSRKYKNLQDANNEVALVIGWDDSITVQIEGVAKELQGQQLHDAKQAYFAKNPRARKWANREGIVYFMVQPNWVRYSDLNSSPWYIQEFDI